MQVSLSRREVRRSEIRFCESAETLVVWRVRPYAASRSAQQRRRRGPRRTGSLAELLCVGPDRRRKSRRASLWLLGSQRGVSRIERGASRRPGGDGESLPGGIERFSL